MSTKKYPEAEPTLYDVIELMQSGFEHMEGILQGMVHEMRTMNQRTFKNELRIEDVADNAHEHEKRIIILERWKKNSGKAGLAGA